MQLEKNTSGQACRGAVTFSQHSTTSEMTYKVGDEVPEDGCYVCVPCGNKKYLKAGMRFGNCLMCLGKDRRFFRKGLELWERVF